MKIGIDARFLGPEGTGIGRYVEKLVTNLESLDKENEYFIFLRKSNAPLFNPKNPNFKKIVADASWYSVKEQVVMPAALRAEKLDLVHFPHFNIPLLYSGKFVVTVHDLTISKFSTQGASTRKAPIYLTKKFAYQFTLNQALKRAEKVFVPSNFVKNDIVNEFGLKIDKLIVTYEAASGFAPSWEDLAPGRIQQVLGKYSLKEPFLIYVGNSYPYKNVGIILESLLKLPNELKFICISPRNNFLKALEEKAKSLGIQNRVVFPGFVPDQDLKILMNQALAFVFPSFSEGFGLPGLEAMEASCPVIAAKASSLPEIYGDAAVYFDPNSVNELVGQIEKFLKNKSLRTKYVNLGLKKSREYSWKITAQETLKVYQQVLNKLEK